MGESWAQPYGSETQVTLTLMAASRWHFPHLYNDCMIEVLKDDKQPPVVQAAPISPFIVMVSLYQGVITVGGTRVHWDGGAFAHDICSELDDLLSNCPSVSDIYAPAIYCVKVP